MAEPAKKIAVVQGAPSAEVQILFRSLVDRWGSSVRLAGVIAEERVVSVTPSVARGL